MNAQTRKLAAPSPYGAASERAPAGDGLEPAGRRASTCNPLFGQACATDGCPGLVPDLPTGGYCYRCATEPTS